MTPDQAEAEREAAKQKIALLLGYEPHNMIGHSVYNAVEPIVKNALAQKPGAEGTDEEKVLADRNHWLDRALKAERELAHLKRANAELIEQNTAIEKDQFEMGEELAQIKEALRPLVKLHAKYKKAGKAEDDGTYLVSADNTIASLAPLLSDTAGG